MQWLQVTRSLRSLPTLTILWFYDWLVRHVFGPAICLPSVMLLSPVLWWVTQPYAFVPPVTLVKLSSIWLSSHIWISGMHIPSTRASARIGASIFLAVNELSHHNMQCTSLGLAFVCCWCCRLAVACREVNLLVLMGLCTSHVLVAWVDETGLSTNGFVCLGTVFFFLWALDSALLDQGLQRLCF